MDNFIKVKALIFNIPPVSSFETDGYLLKREEFDPKIYESVQDFRDFHFYYNEGLLRNLILISSKTYFQVIEKSLEQDELLNAQQKTEEELVNMYSDELRIIERKLKLITNRNVVIPSFLVYGSLKGKTLEFGNITSRISSESTEDITKQEILVTVNRLRFGFDYDWVYKNNSEHIKRSMDLYFSSFEVTDSKIGHTLLFSSLEALFNVRRVKISETLAESVKCILYSDDETVNRELKKSIKKQYDKRSVYIHGGKGVLPNKNDESYLRGIVRKVLITYIFISKETNIIDIKEMLNYINNNRENENSFVLKGIGDYLNDTLEFGKTLFSNE